MGKGFFKEQKKILNAKKEFKQDIEKYNQMYKDGDSFPLNIENNYPIYFDKYKAAGNLDSHYFMQDIYMAQKVIEKKTKHHYDIGSRVDGFIAHLLASDAIELVTLLDIRPLSISIPKLDFIQTDATNLENIPDNSIYSLSSLHAIEHFGLGRYGDEIDPLAWKKAFLAIQRKLAPGGTLYFSVPIGPSDRLCFNAHRIFNPLTVVRTFTELQLESFDFIHDFSIVKSSPKEFETVGGDYDCGLFIFQKKM